MSFSSFKAFDFKAVDGQTPDDFYNCIVSGGINTENIVDLLGYSVQRNTITGTASQALTAPAGLTLSGSSAERQFLLIAVVGTITVAITHRDTDAAADVTNTFSLYGSKGFPGLLAISYDNIGTVTLTGAGSSTDEHTYSAYWTVEAEPTDARLS